MIYVCLALIAAFAVVVSLLAGLLRSQQHAHARERDLLLNQLLHLAGRPWTPAPADEWTAPAPPNGDESEWPTWQAAPEQEPVY